MATSPTRHIAVDYQQIQDEDSDQENGYHDSKYEKKEPVWSQKGVSTSTSVHLEKIAENDAREKEKEQEDLKEARKRFNMSRLMGLAKPERGILIGATVFLFLSSLLNLLVPAFVGVIIDAISSTGDSATISSSFLQTFIDAWGFGNSPSTVLTIAVVALGALVSLGAVFSMLRGYLYLLAGERVVARLRNQLFGTIMYMEVSFFDVTRTGELINRLAADTEVLKNAVTVNISMGLRWAATVVGGIIYLFIISWKLTLVMLSVVPVIAVVGRYYGHKMKQLSKDTQTALAHATEVAEESVSSIRTVRSFYREPSQIHRYEEMIQVTYELGKKSAWLYGAFIGGIGLVGSFAMILVLWYGANLVLNGNMSPGTLTSFVLYTLTVGFSLAGLAGLFGSLMKAIGANDRVFQIIDRKPTIPLQGGETLPTLRGQVNFNRVSFWYPSRPQAQVLNEVSLELKPGTVTALVGASGGGKSTIVSLIERFYDVEPQYGSITIDGYNIQHLDPSWLHRHIGLVSQEPVLFATTIRENLTYGVEKATDAEIDQACRMANAYDFISSFPEKYGTMVGERGVRLSGGQKQRVAIARAILMNPKILIADEATSSLDAESEFHVQEALDRLMQGRTVLVVAHRLSTVKNADNVIVIERGRVVEQGTHDALLKKSGSYAKLVRRQLAPALTQAQPALTNGTNSISTSTSENLVQETEIDFGPPRDDSVLSVLSENS